jgi:predicted nuclease of predicted toxin-antitoxin system
MKPRFLADADLNQKIVLGLLRREPSIDIHTASQGDVIGRPDPEVLTIAARENRILISHDR